MKNNSKKLIAMFAAAMMICGQAGTAAPYVTISAEESVSQTEMISVVIPENTTVTNGMFTVTYDAQKLELINAEAGKAFSGIMTAVNTKEYGKVTLGFVSSKPFNAGGNAFVLTFERKSGTENAADLCSLAVNELITEDESGKETAVKTENIKLETAVSEMTVEVSSSVINGSDVCADINFSENQGVTNGVITVKYDPSVIRFESVSAGELLENAFFEANEISEGTVKIAFVSSTGITAAGNAFNINFSAVSDGASDIGLVLSEFASGSSKINASAVSGSVTVNMKKAELSMDASAAEDGRVNAAVVLPNDTGVTNGVLTVSYDPSVLKFDSASVCGVLEKSVAEINGKEPGTVKIAFVNSTGITEGGEAVKLVFTSSETADTKITVSADEFMKTASDGAVSKISTVPGECAVILNSEVHDSVDNLDINGDGSVSAVDILYFKRVLFEVEEDKQICSNADINGDGEVDVMDLMRLLRFLLGA